MPLKDRWQTLRGNTNTSMEASLSQSDISELLRGISIPSQPQIMADLQLAQAFDPPDLREIGQLISRDISIAGSVIKVANSPFYALPKPVTHIEQAIMILGNNAVLNIVNGVALRQELVDMGRLDDDDVVFLNAFWDSAEDTARVAQLISQQLQMEDPEEMYLLGLFHNGGIPLMVQHFKDYRQVLQQAYAQEQDTLTETEDQHYNTNHAVLGYYLARSWKMPLTVCDAITEHHSLPRLLSANPRAGGQMVNMLAILKLAEHLVGLYRILGNQQIDNEWQALEAPVCEYLNLSQEEINDITALCEEHGIGL